VDTSTRRMLAPRMLTPCEHRKWHLDFDQAAEKPRCSNSWKVPRWAQNKTHLFYDSSEDCCADLFGDKECNLIDACEPEEPSVEDHCIDPLWHFDVDTKGGCTNNARYPGTWKDPHVVGHYLFKTHEECCEKFVKPGFSCRKYDVCTARELKSKNDEEVIEGESDADAEVTGTLWYPSLTGSYSGCVSGTPPSWMTAKGYKDVYVFDSHAECCKTHPSHCKIESSGNLRVKVPGQEVEAK